MHRSPKIIARLLSKIKGYENATPVGSKFLEDFRSRDGMRGGGLLTPIVSWHTRVNRGDGKTGFVEALSGE